MIKIIYIAHFLHQYSNALYMITTRVKTKRN